MSEPAVPPGFDSRWFLTVLRSIGDAVIATDNDGSVKFMNAVAESLTGWSQQEAQGKDLRDVFPIISELTRQPVDDPVAKVLRTGHVQGLANHTLLISRDGKEIPIDDSAAPIVNDAGEILGVVLVFHDATLERKAAETKEHLAAIVENSEDAIVAKDLNGYITGWNSGAERMLGYTAEEVIGQHVSVLMPPDVREDVETILQRIRRGERIAHYHTKRMRKDGAIIDVSLAVSPIRNLYGEVIGAAKIARDISEQKRSESVRNLLAAIVESSEDAIVSKNLEGLVTSWNHGAEAMFGYSAAEMIGKHIKTIIPDDRSEDFSHILERIRRGERIRHYETQRRRKDGKVIDVSLTISPVVDERGEVVGASKIARDISDRKLTEQRLREESRRKDEFLAMLAHELRNPLSSISHAVRLARETPDSEDVEWSKAVIERQLKNLSRLIDDLLDVARITQGKIQLREEDVDIAPVLSTAVDAVRSLIEERKHRLNVSYCPESLYVRGDPTRLEQILVNLLTNAAKYTENGGTIWLSTERNGSHVVLRVKDTGMGISAEALPKMFELFTQGERSLARSEGGLGLGLPLIKALTEMHHGAVEAHSEGPGKGSEFVVRLPLAKTARDEQARSKSPGRSTGSSRVLIVDDNVDTARSLARLLSLLGHEVAVSYNGHEAIAAARTLVPEFILLDIGLPGMDGFEVARRLKQESAGKDAVLIATTGYGEEEMRNRVKAAGFEYHLVKPVDYDELSALLARTR